MENQENPTPASTPTATPAANPEPTPPPASTAPTGTATTPPPAGATKPLLYNPNVASSLSVFFTPIFGSWCCKHNYEALNLLDKARRSKAWMIISIVYILLALVVPTLGKGWLLFLIVWYLCDGRKQHKYLKDNNISYEKKEWRKPVFVALGMTIGAIILLLLLSGLFASKSAIRGEGDVERTTRTGVLHRLFKGTQNERAYYVGNIGIFGNNTYVCGNCVGIANQVIGSQRETRKEFVVFDIEQLRKALNKAYEWGSILRKKGVTDKITKRIGDINIGFGHSQQADFQARLREQFMSAENDVVTASMDFSGNGYEYSVVLTFGQWSTGLVIIDEILKTISQENIANVIKKDEAERARTDDLLK